MRTLFYWIAGVCIVLQADQLMTNGLYTSKFFEMSSRIGHTFMR